MMQNNTTEALQSLVIHTMNPRMCMHIFTTPPRMSDVATRRRHITQHSYLTAHISSVLGHTHTHTLVLALTSCQAPKAVTLADSVEGVGVDGMKAGIGGKRGGKRVKDRLRAR